MLPMFSGSGIKNKVLEAFPRACRWSPMRSGSTASSAPAPGEHYLLAETADEIAAAAGRLLTEPVSRSALARAARGLIEERYTWDRQAEAMLALYGL